MQARVQQQHIFVFGSGWWWRVKLEGREEEEEEEESGVYCSECGATSGPAGQLPGGLEGVVQPDSGRPQPAVQPRRAETTFALVRSRHPAAFVVRHRFNFNSNLRQSRNATFVGSTSQQSGPTRQRRVVAPDLHLVKVTTPLHSPFFLFFLTPKELSVELGVAKERRAGQRTKSGMPSARLHFREF
jgi:hypothetical protein